VHIQTLFDKYIKLYPHEVDGLKLLSGQLEQTDDITSRKNFVGHVTASAFIINERTKQILLLEHKALAKLLQPGGHVEPEDGTLLESTQREITEETGLQPSALTLRPITSDDREVPFDINTHFIPENPKKEEPGHYHHDFRYIYTTKSDDIAIDPTESTSYKWVEWDQFLKIPNFTHVANKIDMIL
jgi:8-oxo-dGTP pyrophosphatase MutT (NUDIX family)